MKASALDVGAAFAPEKSRTKFVLLAAILTLIALPAFGDAGHARSANEYSLTLLVSDGTVPASHTDPHIVNGWGIAASATGPWWVADNETGVSTLYDGLGAAQPLVVSLPDGAGSAPTGLSFYGGAGFPVSDGTTSGPARFLFASEEGKVFGWSPGVPPPPLSSQAFVVLDESSEGAIYKGLTIAATAAGDRLYITDFHQNAVDAYDGNFQDVSLPPGAFQDPRIPGDFAPFGIRVLAGRVFVTYARQDEDKEDDVAGQGLGFVDVFDTEGTLLGRIATRGQLNAPWGLALAPDGFGRFGGDLLVGNFGDGKILAFRLNADMTHATFEGVLRASDHRPIAIEGLWGIDFGNGAAAGPADTLFFAAGPDDESHGVFGRVDPQ